MNDPWKHRSDGMKCKTCMWFCPKVPATAPVIGPQDEMRDPEVINIGRCRKHAPTMNGYPVVFVNDWCGDHKLNEAAV